MKTVKWSLKKKYKKNRVNSLPFCTLLLMMTVKRKKVIVFILKEKIYPNFFQFFLFIKIQRKKEGLPRLFHASK